MLIAHQVVRFIGDNQIPIAMHERIVLAEVRVSGGDRTLARIVDAFELRNLEAEILAVVGPVLDLCIGRRKKENVVLAATGEPFGNVKSCIGLARTGSVREQDAGLPILVNPTCSLTGIERTNARTDSGDGSPLSSKSSASISTRAASLCACSTADSAAVPDVFDTSPMSRVTWSRGITRTSTGCFMFSMTCAGTPVSAASCAMPAR
ncbi:hypothetical protein J2802_004677 [Paraburkholderia caribensis]|nr:hypothetical protein [Paraburkholderia caribensis]MDR6384246.1 hypothetical protein [Paraburkholderia caribensis]